MTRHRLLTVKIGSIAFGVLMALMAILLPSCATMGIEKASYTVVKKQGSLEIRRYPTQIVAETIVDASFDKAGNVAFRLLFDYISGQNRKKESIAMTAPVNQQASAEKIAMTAPVNQQQIDGRFVVSFLMPARYSLATLPEPLNPAVTLREVPGHTLAAIRYSGTWSQKRYEIHKATLEAFIRENKLTPTGPPVFARYDPPFQLWFIRRNEVLIPVD